MNGIEMDVHKIIGFLDQFDFKHLCIQSKDLQITAVSSSVSGSVDEQVGKVAVSSTEKASSAGTGIGAGYSYLKSPLLGVFHGIENEQDLRSLEGRVIERGELLGYVKTLEASREVLADQGGEIVRVCVQDNDFVAYGRTLFVLRETNREVAQG